MQYQQTLIVWGNDVPYLVKINRDKTDTVYEIDRADDDFIGTYADVTRTWRFPTEVVEEMGGDQAQLEALLFTLAPRPGYADPALLAMRAA